MLKQSIDQPNFNYRKKDQTVKIALDSEKKIKKFINKNKYQFPNIELQ